MTDTGRTRRVHPDTGEDWRALGFYHEPDTGRREWRFEGSPSGLRTLARMLQSQADKSSEGVTPGALPVGPFADLHIRVWERPGIDDESIHGPAEALRRLSGLVHEWLATARPNDEFRIRDDFARDAEYGLYFVLRDEAFDPASAMPVPVKPVDAVGEDTLAAFATPALPFKFHDPDEFLTETVGLVRIEDDALVVEFQSKNALLSGFGVFKPEIETVAVRIERIASVRFRRGLFSVEMAVQALDMVSFADIPTNRQGRLRFRFKRALRNDAEQLADTLQSLIEDTV